MSLGLTTLALLAGCAQPAAPIRAFESETGPYTARLLVRPSMAGTEAFGVYVLGNAQQCGDARRLMVGNKNSPAAGTLIRAERLTTLSTMIVGTDGRCSAELSFVPRTGRSYAVVVATEAKQCWSLVYDVSDPDKSVLEPSLRRRDGAGRNCRPLAESLAPPAARMPDAPPPSASSPAGSQP